MDFCFGICGLPSRVFWAAFLFCAYVFAVHEDNQAMTRVVGTGRNPTVRYFRRVRRVVGSTNVSRSSFR
eukprot:10482758-Lingulodinium_polyedra.AAC.1